MKLPDTYTWFRTHRSRRIFSQIGFLFWSVCVIGALTHTEWVTITFFVLTEAWAISIFAVLFRDQWENRR